MEEQIQVYLNKLIGLDLTRTTRAATMECLKFGELTKSFDGELLNIGLFGIHLQCPWRFVNDKKIIIGSHDLYEHPSRKYVVDFDWESNKNLRDLLLHVLITRNKLTVTQTSADKFGGFGLEFSNSFKLQVFPTSSMKDEYSEYWRILSNDPNKLEHFVVGGNGIYISEEKTDPNSSYTL